MPLLDHFTEPIDPRKKWASFHAYWAAAIGRGLNRTLPKRFFAGVNVHLGRQVATDVAEYDLGPETERNGTSVGLAVQIYAPPVATGSWNALFADTAEVTIVDTDVDRLVAVVELVSPGNKDRPEARRAFAMKCAGFLAQGVGVIVVDTVLKHHFNLHDGLIDALRLPETLEMNGTPSTYAVSYRPFVRVDVPEVEFWANALRVGDALPILPFALKGWGCVPVNMEAFYAEACRDCRLA